MYLAGGLACWDKDRAAREGCSPGEVRHMAGWLLRSCTKEVAFVGGKAYKRMVTLENWAEFVVVECW